MRDKTALGKSDPTENLNRIIELKSRRKMAIWTILLFAVASMFDTPICT